MLNVSNDFKERMKRRMKEIDAYIFISETEKITSADDLISFKISCESGMAKASMRKLEAKYLGEHNLLDKWIKPGFGVKLENGNFDYMNYGSFLVTEITYTKDTGVTNIVAYDKMINSMKLYEPLIIEYPMNLLDYTNELCNACGLGMVNLDFVNSDLLITEELWENINGITYRDIFVQIAQITCTTCIISDDMVFFKPITDINETLTYSNIKKLKLEPSYGEINSVVLGRDPIVGEDVFIKDDDSISEFGLTEFRISNNEIVDKRREEVIETLYNAYKGISFYPFETTTEGFGWYEIGDQFIIENDIGEQFPCVLFNYSILVDGAVTEILKATAETKTQSQYQYASKISKRIKNAEIIVNKQEQYIEQIVSDVSDSNEKVAQTLIDVNGVKTTVSNNEKTTNDNIESMKELISSLEQTARNLSITITSINEDGVNKVVTKNGFVFDENGLNLSKDGEPMSAILNWEGLLVKHYDTDILDARGDRLIAENLTVKKYLTTGRHRFEKFNDEKSRWCTGFFWIGDDE